MNAMLFGRNDPCTQLDMSQVLLTFYRSIVCPQDLSFQGGIGDLDADVLGLVFLPNTACLLASDSGGDVVLWVAEFGKAAAAAGDSSNNTNRCAVPRESSSLPTKAAAADAAVAAKAVAEPYLRQDIRASGGGRSAPAWEADAEFVAGDTGGTGTERMDATPRSATAACLPNGDIAESIRKAGSTGSKTGDE